MLENGWIKLHRKLLHWEWYDDVPTARLFIHLLLTVSIKEDSWHGVSIPRGGRVTSISALAEETHLSEQQVKTALRHLTKTHEITKQSTRSFTLITVVRYDDYQSEQPAVNPPLTDDSPAVNLPLTDSPPTANHSIRKQEYKNKRKKENKERPEHSDTDGGYYHGAITHEFYECETIL